MVKVNIENALGFLDKNALDKIDVSQLSDTLPRLDGAGWLTLPADFKISDSINAAAHKISRQSEVFIVIGVGGSYLGTRAALDYIKSPLYNALPKTTPDILFAGNNLSGEYLSQVIELIGERDFSVNIVSKSGSTLEPAAALRVFKDKLLSHYGAGALRERLFVTTDNKNSPLYDMAQSEGCTLFTMPEGVGGRYSVLTAVGLLPCAVCGIDIDAVMMGAREEMESGLENACQYARVRQALYRAGKKIELLASFEPAFRYTGEWWKQLFGESEGKNGLGIFPAYADYTADLHSLGQYVQEGERTLFETFVSFDSPRTDVTVPGGDHCDKITPLSGMGFSELNRAALSAVKKAHIDGGVPVIDLHLPCFSGESFGALVYFFEKACALSALISGVNPFDQPGVEAYKRNLYSILNIC